MHFSAKWQRHEAGNGKWHPHAAAPSKHTCLLRQPRSAATDKRVDVFTGQAKKVDATTGPGMRSQWQVAAPCVIQASKCVSESLDCRGQPQARGWMCWRGWMRPLAVACRHNGKWPPPAASMQASVLIAEGPAGRATGLSRAIPWNGKWPPRPRQRGSSTAPASAEHLNRALLTLAGSRRDAPSCWPPGARRTRRQSHPRTPAARHCSCATGARPRP